MVNIDKLRPWQKFDYDHPKKDRRKPTPKKVKTPDEVEHKLSQYWQDVFQQKKATQKQVDQHWFDVAQAHRKHAIGKAPKTDSGNSDEDKLLTVKTQSGVEGGSRRNDEDVEIYDLKSMRNRRLSNLMDTLIGKLAQDMTGFPVEGDDEWDMHALMRRHIDKKPLSHCRQSREKERIIVYLDCSGSCGVLSSFYSEIAETCIKRGDVFLIRGGNSHIVSYFNPWLNNEDPWQPIPPSMKRYRKMPMSAASRRMLLAFGIDGDDLDYFYEHNSQRFWSTFFRNRTIIYFGDSDGFYHTMEASVHNKLYMMFQNASYPGHPITQDPWRHASEIGASAKIYTVNKEKDIIKVIKKIK